jgi:hypothetical protein
VIRFLGLAIVMGLFTRAAPACALQAGQAETREWGDTSGIRAISAATRRITDETGDWRSTVTREDVPGLPRGDSVEVRLATIRGQPARIIARAWTDAGRYSLELYLMGGALLLAFETLEFTEERAPPGAWRNAEGSPAWERRTWFLGGAMVAARTIGREGPPPGEDGERLSGLARRLVALFPG